MRKFTSLLLGLLFASFAFAKSVTIEQASQVANKYLSVTSKKAARSVANSFSESYNGITTYYVFNYTGGGFVVVSADDAAIPILAQSDEGFIEQEITNPALRYWLEGYSKEIAYIIENKLDNNESHTAWNSILNNEIKAPLADVAPLLKTMWDQGQWYNYYCPTFTGSPNSAGKALTGCVATTMAQIMKYHNFPATGVGSHTSIHPLGALSANFGATNYNFASMRNTATNTSYTAIATLMYHAGVSVNMDYGRPDGSAAFSDDVPWAMSNYFNYDNASISMAYRSDYSPADWKTLLISELVAKRPLYYSGSDPPAGHAWVCDGYRSSDDKFHMNWGWSGSDNGYFTVGALNTNSGNFNSRNAVIYGIKPGNPDLIVRFTDLQQYNFISLGTSFDINCSVIKGIPTAVNLYIDNKLVYNTSQTTFTYAWNTANTDLSTMHVIRVEAIDPADTVYQEVYIGMNDWIAQASGFSAASRGISDIHAVDSITAWAIAYDGSGGTAAVNEFTKTTNGGISWTPGKVLGGSTYGLGNICGLNKDIAYVTVYNKNASQDNTCGVYKTSNGGTSWTHLTGALQGAASFANNVWFWDENNGMCHGDVTGSGTEAYFEIYTTTNGGSTWTRVPKSDIGGGVAPLTGEGGWTSVIQTVGTNTIMFGTNKGNLFISHDRGFHWTISNTGINPITDGVNIISFKDDLNGLVAQTKTTVVLRETHDGGLTWKTINPTGPFLTSDLVYVPGTDSTFVSTGSEISASGASYSFDGGYTWSQFLWTETDQFLAVDFVNNRCGWAGAFNTSASLNGMYKYSGTLDPKNVLSPVTNLTATPNNNSVQLSWTDPATVPLSYSIYRNDTLLASNITSLQYTDSPVAEGSQNYCVTANYDLGQSPKTCITTFITLNIPNTDEAAYRVYPNPSNEIIHVVTPLRFNEVRLVNNLGKIVYRYTNKGTNLNILTEGFESGMYILQIYTGKQVISKKVSIIR